MDLVSRLKNFMDFMNIPVTKFADTCSIPRPSMTQLLKGRNKKVSDEVIAKIHVAYPALNISWLLFGEGDMVTDSNFKISEPQTTSESDNITTSTSDFHPETFDETSLFSIPEIVSGKFSKPVERVSPPTPTQKSSIQPAPLPVDTVTSETNRQQPRRVTNIMVFYSDNSFETFLPQDFNK